MTILFLGGTGRLSKDVAKLAVDQGNEVFLLTRGSDFRKQFVDDRYHMIYGDVREKEEAKKIISPYYFDVVVDFLTCNVDHLENTLDIISGKYKQYIFISTCAVYKRRQGEVISEDKTEIGNDYWNYAYDKFLCEKKIKEYFYNRSEVYTIIRPGVTYGNTRIPYPIITQDTEKEYSFLYRIINDQPIAVFDQGLIMTTLTHTRDFAKGVVGLMCNNSAFGEAFHITSDEKTNWGEVLDDLEDILGKKIIRLQLRQEDIYSEIPYYRDILLGDKGLPSQYDNSKIKSVVKGLSFDVRLIDGLRETVNYLLENKSMQLLDYRWLGEMDRLSAKQGIKVKQSISGMRQRISYLQGRYRVVGAIGKYVKKVKCSILK